LYYIRIYTAARYFVRRCYLFYHKQIILSIVFLLSLDIIRNIKYNDIYEVMEWIF